MNSLQLPKGYRLVREVDLMKDKKLALWINLAALLVCVPLVAVRLLLHPAAVASVSLPGLLVKAGITLAGIVGYIILHELTHGLFIRLYCGEKAEYGFNGLYAYAGKKNACFDKRSYCVIALSPVVLWGVVLLVLNLLLPAAWFWPVYLIQILNLSGAVGDAYVFFVLSKMPGDVLINDDGVSMRFYTQNQA